MGSALDTSVKVIRNTYPGCPGYTNTRGDMVKVLDAVLVNGFGQRNIDSASYADGVITYNIASNPFPEWVVVRVAGSSDPELNGEFRVINSSSGYVKIPVTNVSAAPVSTAGMTIEFAPLGYEIYRTNGGGKRVYRSKNVHSNKTCLVVHDEAMVGYTHPALYSQVGVVEDCSGVEPEDFIGAQCPLDPGRPFSNWKPDGNRKGWYKWYYKVRDYESMQFDGTGTKFVFIGDDMLFFYEAETCPGWYGRMRYIFGEVETLSPGDKWATIFQADETDDNDNNYYPYPGFDMGAYGSTQGGWNAGQRGRQILSRHDGSVNGTRWTIGWLRMGPTDSPLAGVNDNMVWPNPATGQTLFFPITLQGTEGIRANFPGMYACAHSRDLFRDYQVVLTTVNPGEPKRRMMLTRCQWSSESTGAVNSYDITGPWRNH